MNFLAYLSLIGIFVFSISCSISAIKKRFDLFGIAFISFISVTGGSTFRDILIGQKIVWVQNILIPLAILLGICISIIFNKKLLKFKKSFFFFDTLGLAIATISGIKSGQLMNIPFPQTIIFGVLSSILGGVIRDVMCNDIPYIFRSELYATASILGGLIYLGLKIININDLYSIFITIIAIFIIRYIAVKYSIKLPILRIN